MLARNTLVGVHALAIAYRIQNYKFRDGSSDWYFKALQKPILNSHVSFYNESQEQVITMNGTNHTYCSMERVICMYIKP